MVLQKTFESFFDNKDIKSVNSKEINPEYSSKRLMPKLKLQYFDSPMWRADSLKRPWCWEELRAGGERGWQRTRWLDGIIHTWTWVWAILGDSEGPGSLVCCSPWGHMESDTTEWLNNNKTSNEYLWIFVKWTKHDYHNIYSHVFNRIFLNPRLGFIVYCSFCSQFSVHFVHNNNPLFMLLDRQAFHLFGRHSIKLEDCFQNNLKNCST